MAGLRGGLRTASTRAACGRCRTRRSKALLGNAKLIRHWGKLKSVRDNAAAMLEIAAEHSSFGAWLAAWPGADIVGLWEALAKQFSQMGGNSGPSFLRMVGKDTFVLSPSVCAGLKHWAGIAAPPKNRSDRARRPGNLQRTGPPKPAFRSVISA